MTSKTSFALTTTSLLIAILWSILRDLLPWEMGLFLLGGAAVLLLPLFAAELLLSRLPKPKLSNKAQGRIVLAMSVGGPLLLAIKLLGADALAPTPLGPLVALAVCAWLLLERLAPTRLFPDDPRFWSAACIAAAELLLLFTTMHLTTQTFEWVRPGSEQLHLLLYASTWLATIGLVYPWALRIRARSGVSSRPRARALWTGLALLAGIALLEIDRFAMVGLYPSVHTWMAVIGVLTLDAALAPWLVSARGEGPRRRSTRLGVGLLSFAVLVGSALAALEGGRSGDPGFRASVAETAIGPKLLDLWPALEREEDSVEGSTDHPLLDYEHFRDERWPENDLNILLISVDALRADAVPVAGGPNRDLAPNYADLAEKCADFRWAYSPSSRTSTSMGSLMVGRYNANVQWRLWIWKAGRLINPRDPAHAAEFEKLGNKYVYTTMPDIPKRGNLAQRLSAIGLYTAATPYAGFNQFFKEGFGFDVGFDAFEDLTTRKGWRGSPTSQKIAKIAAQQLRPHVKERWFQWIHFYDPHESGMKPERYQEMVAEFDAGLGKTLRWLERQGVRDRTAIFLVADHGEALGGHRHRSHGTSLYEEQVRVPMLVCIPGMKPGVFQQQTTVLDVTATILALVSADTAELDGVNLLPLIADGRYPERRPVFTELSRYMSSKAKRTSDIKAVVVDGWKYIWNRHKGTRMLFDLNTAPDEKENLLGQEKARASELGALLETFVNNGESRYPLP